MTLLQYLTGNSFTSNISSPLIFDVYFLLFISIKSLWMFPFFPYFFTDAVSVLFPSSFSFPSESNEWWKGGCLYLLYSVHSPSFHPHIFCSAFKGLAELSSYPRLCMCCVFFNIDFFCSVAVFVKAGRREKTSQFQC